LNVVLVNVVTDSQRPSSTRQSWDTRMRCCVWRRS